VKASKLIECLQKAISDHGDLDVVLDGDGELAPAMCAGIARMVGDGDNKTFHFMICDDETLDAFSE
jgi:hypothetical protein